MSFERKRWYLIALSVIALTACSGGSTVMPSTPPAAPTPGLFLYVGNTGSADLYDRSNGSLSAYGVDAATGTLVPIAGSPFALPDGPYGLAVHPSGRALYAGAGHYPGPWVVSAYSVDPTSGVLRLVPDSAVAAPPLDPQRRGPFVTRVIEVHPSGRYAYVLYGFDDYLCEVQGQVRSFAVDPASGALAALAAPPVNASNAESGAGLEMTLAPSGRHLYTANTGHVHDLDSCYRYSTLRGFTVDETTGALATIPGSPFAQMPRYEQFTWVVPAPSEQWVYAGSSAGIFAFRQEATGALADGRLFAIAPGITATFSPAGRLYVTDKGSVRGFDFDPQTGALTALSGSPYPGAERPSRPAMDGLGRVAFVADAAWGAVWAYAVDAATGALRPAPGSPFAAGTGTLSVVVASVR